MIDALAKAIALEVGVDSWDHLTESEKADHRNAASAAICMIIPAGGMALTAEQVEDVRTVANCALQYGNIASRVAASRLDSSLPATEPAEEFKPSQSIGEAVIRVWKAFTPAPAEPAEEETKAEACAGIFQGDRAYLCALAAGHYGDHTTAKGEHWQKRPTSSPVVPAPTETGPWPSLKDIPAEVSEVRDVGKNLWRRKGGNWEWKTADGRWFEVFNPRAADDLAPFVAAEG